MSANVPPVPISAATPIKAPFDQARTIARTGASCSRKRYNRGTNAPIQYATATPCTKTARRVSQNGPAALA